ncbi:Holliday junction resolvase RuvX [Patescibacteria group bacterium]|nr:Holliday junction resolvase RuvX [Patescibacteria group bacterium]
MKYLGIDYGTKRIGVAVSNKEGTLAFPHSILANTPNVIDEIHTIIQSESIDGIIVGDSLNTDGSPNQLGTDVEKFATHLTESTGCSVQFQDERFSSIAAQAHLYGKGNIANEHWTETNNAKKRDHHDAQAATIILQRFLDRQHLASS